MIKIHIASISKDFKSEELHHLAKVLPGIELVESPESAEVVLLTDDDFRHIRDLEAFRRFKSKCIIISDSDVLSYYAPALYASNSRGWLSSGRALTSSPYSSLLDEGGKRNVWINSLKHSSPPKKYLYSFMGGSTCLLRKRLFKNYKSFFASDVLINSTDHYRHWSNEDIKNKLAQQRLFVETLLQSKFAVCPRGASASSIRLFEAMELGVAPVVLADDWIPVHGIDWSFCIFVKEAKMKNLDAIIRSHSTEWAERGRDARLAFNANFSAAQLGYTWERQLRQLLSSRNSRREQSIRAVYPIYHAYLESRAVARSSIRSMVLSAFRAFGKKFPYELNR